MAYYENITAGRGAIDNFANALNNQRFANLMLNETISNFSNNIIRAGALFDESKIREDALKYQRMRDLANDKKQAEAFELQKRQVEQSMDFAKRQQRMSEEMHKQNKRLNEQKEQAMKLENKLTKHQHDWLMEAKPSAKASVSVDNNNAMKTPTTPSANHTQGVLNTQSALKPKTITKEEFKAVYANPMFRF
ncbi:hypothetical protein KVK84_02120 [Helicobacter pylori]|nr:hypothetical protein KVK84_02120 [Helicobacter pylori]